MLAIARVVSGMSLEERIRFHQNRVSTDLDYLNESDRGAARPVVRGDWEEYPSVSAAARAQPGNVKPDWICQAIRRNGTCAGHRWAYLDEIPAGFFSPDKESGASCPWPFVVGNPVIYPERLTTCSPRQNSTAETSLSA